MTTRFFKRTLSLILAICMVLSALTVTAFADTATWKPADPFLFPPILRMIPQEFYLFSDALASLFSVLIARTGSPFFFL